MVTNMRVLIINICLFLKYTADSFPFFWIYDSVSRKIVYEKYFNFISNLPSFWLYIYIEKYYNNGIIIIVALYIMWNNSFIRFCFELYPTNNFDDIFLDTIILYFNYDIFCKWKYGHEHGYEPTTLAVLIHLTHSSASHCKPSFSPYVAVCNLK